jgi:pyruvate formate lyase activating enzyme
MRNPGTVECQLCPKYCHIPPGMSGDCRIRLNLDGKLIASTNGLPCSVHVDPIEKKPLFHFLPGTGILSAATVGCNLHCTFCQNWSISQANPEDVEAYPMSAAELAEVANQQKTPSLALTYTDPVCWFEYTVDVCRAARDKGIKTVLVTAGYLNDAPLRELLPLVDAANVDLKAYSEDFYRDVCKGNLRPVLHALELCVELGVWLEVTNLIVPTLNDDMGMIRKMCDWMRTTLGVDVPLHFSRFSPRYQLRNIPPTPGDTLEEARRVALDAGLRHVYMGNLLSRDGESTFCPNTACPERATPLVSREGFTVTSNRLASGRCPSCGTAVAGVWDSGKGGAR